MKVQRTKDRKKDDKFILLGPSFPTKSVWKNIKLLKKFKPRPHCSELKRIKMKRGKKNKLFSSTIPQSKAEKYRNHGI